MSLIKGVKFNEIHSYDDLGLILKRVTIPNPQPKYNFVSVPGSSEVIDLTEAFGDITFEQRTLTFTFISFESFDGRLTRNGMIANLLHGNKMKIILDEDRGHYYLGRVDFKTWEVNKKTNTLTFECICDPYRYDIESSANPWEWDLFSFVDGIITDATNWYINGSAVKEIWGTNKTIYPEVKCSAPMTVRFDNGDPIEFPEGTTKAYDMPIPKGEVKHTLNITGTGTFVIDYRQVTF